jgi:hypothetical protein
MFLSAMTYLEEAKLDITIWSFLKISNFFFCHRKNVYCQKSRIGTEKPLSNLQGVPTQTVIFHFALAGRNLQARFGLKVIRES